MPQALASPGPARWGRLLAATVIACLLALAHASARAGDKPPAPVAVPDTLAQRLQPCLACHGAQGRASAQGYVPRIAGKPAGYLLHQLLNFRDGRRRHATMSHFLANQGDAYLAEMAAHFAGMDAPYPSPPAPPDNAATALARGALLAQQGDAGRQLPACQSCHGAALTGRQPAVPGLLGLPRDYLIAQLGAWQTGSRQALAPDCMATIARSLAPQDISAVALWLASQPVPTHPQAVAANDGLATLPWPAGLPCGSQPRSP